MNECSVEQQVGLIDAIAQGDQSAFEKLYRLTSPRLFAVAQRMLRNPPGQKKYYTTVFLLSGVGLAITMHNSVRHSPG